jgi:hypothetical protein
MFPTNDIAAEVGRSMPLMPIWLRIPDAVRVSGVGRSSLYKFIRTGQIKSVVLRDRNKVRGIRLVNAASLDSFIEGHANQRREHADESA